MNKPERLDFDCLKSGIENSQNQYYNMACDDWERYLTDLLAPLKSEWESFKHILGDKYTCADVTTIELLKAIKPIAERLNW